MTLKEMNRFYMKMEIITIYIKMGILSIIRQLIIIITILIKKQMNGMCLNQGYPAGYQLVWDRHKVNDIYKFNRFKLRVNK